MPTRETYNRTGGGSGSAAYPQGGRGIPAARPVAETRAERDQRWNRERFLRAAQAQTTINNVTAMYDRAVGVDRFFNKAEADRLDRDRAATDIGYDKANELARQGANLDIFGAAIAQRLAQQNLGSIPEEFDLNNQLFGIALQSGRTKLDRADELDKFAQSTRTVDLQDIMNQRAGVTEDKRLADFNVSGKAGAESGIASGSARMGFKANTEAANIGGERINVLDARSSQQLQEALSNNEYDRKMVNWDLQTAGVSRRQREIDIQSRERALKAEAEKAGLDRRRYEIALQTKLNEMNLERIMSVGQFAEAIHKNQIAGIKTDLSVASAVAANPTVARARRTVARGGRRG